MKVICLDQSTRLTGFAVFDNDVLVKSGVYCGRDKDTIERMVKHKTWLKSMIKEHSPDIVVMEDLQGGAFTKVTSILAKLLGVLEVYLKEKNICYYIININSWKALSGIPKGKREMQKLASVELVRKMYNMVTTDDESDAILMYSGFRKLFPKLFDKKEA